MSRPILEAAGRCRQVRDPGPARGDAPDAGDDPQGREFHRRHRQRAARLPDRPVPDPGTGHLGQDAVDRQADEGRRAVRDRRGRIGAQARAAAERGKPPALGQPGRVLRAGREAASSWPKPRAMPRRAVLGDAVDEATHKAAGERTIHQSAKSASPTTGQPFLLCALLGRGAGGTELRLPILQRISRPSRRRWRTRRIRSWPS